VSSTLNDDNNNNEFPIVDDITFVNRSGSNKSIEVLEEIQV
jgi:hypothetical protein